jgi:soluble lytic murein transglycosylase
MERQTLWVALSRRSRRVAVVLVAALAGCSSAVLLYSGTKPPASQRPPSVTALPSAAASTAKPIALELFSPLGAEARFHPIVEQLEADQPNAAAEALERLRSEEPALDTPLVALWSGRLWERVGAAENALHACEKAAVPSAALQDYARLCVARALSQLKRYPEALARLRDRPYVPAVQGERRLLEARAQKGNGELPAALDTFRNAVTLAPEGAERARVELELGETLLAPAVPNASAAGEALSLVRHAAAVLATDRAVGASAALLEQRALAALPPAERQARAVPSLEEQVIQLAALLEARDFAAVEAQATAALAVVPESDRFDAPACEARLLRGKALAGRKKFAAAVDALAEVRERCTERELLARTFYLSGRYAASDGRPLVASEFFAEVEKRFPEHTLADDARFQAAIAQEDLGVDARATELLLSIAEDYPRGDMAPEALFRLALRRMESARWADALGLLDRGLALLGDAEAGRSFELAGRERFFRGRALLALDQRADAITEFETVVQARPLSYYMLQAYSWLERTEAGRAGSAVERAEALALSQPFHIAGRKELEGPGFSRMMELLRIGELDQAVRELDELGLRKDGTGSEILWSIALLYERAGFTKFSSALTRQRLSEVSGRWPVGEWARAWQIAFPRPYLDVVSRETTRAAIEPALAYAIMREESAFDPQAVSAANAYGLMQLIVPTAAHVAKAARLPSGPAALLRPSVNIALGCRELARLGGLFEQNPLLAVPAYNAGPARAARWLKDRPTMDFDLWVERIPFQETRRYTKRVLSSRAIYAYLYEREHAATQLTLPAKSGG